MDTEIKIHYCEYHREPICDTCGYCVKDVEHLRHVRDDTEHEPVAREEKDEQWEYVETACAAELRIGEITLRPHWTGLADGEEIRKLLKQVITEHNQHHSLLTERDRYTRLLEAAKLLLAMNNCNYDRDQIRRSGGFETLREAVDALDPEWAARMKPIDQKEGER